jgi:hypothetical protein
MVAPLNVTLKLAKFVASQLKMKKSRSEFALSNSATHPRLAPGVFCQAIVLPK